MLLRLAPALLMCSAIAPVHAVTSFASAGSLTANSQYNYDDAKSGVGKLMMMTPAGLTIDLVKQVREMLEDVKPEHGLIGPLRQAEKLLCRGIVEQSLSIGFAPIESEPEPSVTAP